MSDVEIDKSEEMRRAWLLQVLGFSVEQGALVLDAEDGTSGDKIDPAELRSRLNEIGLRVRVLGADPEAEEIKQQFKQAVAALDSGDLETTSLILDEIEPLIAGALSAARGADAARVIGSAKAWRSAVARIADALLAFKGAALSVLEADDREPEEIADVAEQLEAEIADITGKLGEGLADQIDAVINGGAERRKAGVQTILKRIDAVEDQIVNHDGVEAIEDNGVILVAIREPARAALNEMRAALGEIVEQADKVAA